MPFQQYLRIYDVHPIGYLQNRNLNVHVMVVDSDPAVLILKVQHLAPLNGL